MSQPSAVDLFRQAMAAARAGDKARTCAFLQEAVRIDPNSETTWQWLATVVERPLEATQAWERVLAINPNNEKAKLGIRPVRLQAGIEAAKAKDIPTARRLLRAAVADEPKNEHGWLWLASVCSSPAEAKAHLERVLFLNPESGAARKGVVYYDAKIKKQQAAAAPAAPTRVLHPVAPPTLTDTPFSVAAALRDVTQDTLTAPPELLPGEPRKVLVVDASRTHRKLVGMVVAVDGYTLVEAEDADEAIDRIRDDGVPDLIVLDSRLGGLGATEFCALLRQHPDTEGVPVVLLDGPDGQGEKGRHRPTNVSAVTGKPLQPDALLTLVREHATTPPHPVS